MHTEFPLFALSIKPQPCSNFGKPIMVILVSLAMTGLEINMFDKHIYCDQNEFAFLKKHRLN